LIPNLYIRYLRQEIKILLKVWSRNRRFSNFWTKNRNFLSKNCNKNSKTWLIFEIYKNSNLVRHQIFKFGHKLWLIIWELFLRAKSRFLIIFLLFLFFVLFQIFFCRKSIFLFPNLLKLKKKLHKIWLTYLMGFPLGC